MNPMTKVPSIAIAVALVVAIPASLTAQDSSSAHPASQSMDRAPSASRPTPAQLAVQALQLIVAQIDNLTADQRTAIAKILDDAAAKGHALIDNPVLSKKDRRLKMAGLVKDAGDAVRAVLRQDQQRQFDAVIEAMKTRQRP